MNKNIVKMVDEDGTEYVVNPGTSRVGTDKVDGQNVLTITGPDTHKGIMLEKIKWRAKKGEAYYFVGVAYGTFEVSEDNDTMHFIDNERNEAGNYFKTKEEAEEVLNKILEVFNSIV